MANCSPPLPAQAKASSQAPGSGCMPEMGDPPPRVVSDTSLVKASPPSSGPPFPNQDPCSGIDSPSPGPQGVSFQSSLLPSGKQRVTEESPGGRAGRGQQGPDFLPSGYGPHCHMGWATTSEPRSAPTGPRQVLTRTAHPSPVTAAPHHRDGGPAEIHSAGGRRVLYQVTG